MDAVAIREARRGTAKLLLPSVPIAESSVVLSPVSLSSNEHNPGRLSRRLRRTNRQR
jgi:hypothetical protein